MQIPTFMSLAEKNLTVHSANLSILPMCCGVYGDGDSAGGDLLPSMKLQTLSSTARRGGGACSLTKSRFKDTDKSSMSGNSSEPTRGSIFGDLRGHLSRLGRQESSEAPNPSSMGCLLHGETQDRQSDQNVSASELHEQPTEVWIPSDEGDTSSATIKKGSLRGVTISRTVNGNSLASNFCQDPSHCSHSAEAYQVPYIFEFIPFPGHTCMGRGTIPLGTVLVSIDCNSEITPAFKFNASFQRLLNKYNHQSHISPNDPVELRNVTGVTLRSRVEFRSAVRLTRDMRERKMLVVTLLKSYPRCEECKERGRLHENPPS
ncbi:hypothetical protein F5882DRAFT_501328 [Hyaloscypha sp. PMI_1271]|nr:hypothetical protein F5882DRAFT_501328 [Hyaloscypha sp. PMI_1271]